MILPASAVLASTKTQQVITPAPQQTTTGLVWDNVLGYHGALGGIIVATVRPDGIAYPADDFQLSTARVVNHVEWQGGYFQTQLAQGDIDYNWDWRVLFWDDCGDGTAPGNIIYNQTISTNDITRTLWYIFIREDTGNHYWVANYSADLPQSFTFNANQKYWITIQGIGAYPPQACWCRHNESGGGILLHQAKFKGDLWGYTAWTDIQVLAPDQLPHDLNFQLWGEEGDFTPPTTTCTLTGDYDGTNYTSPVIVTLTAVDTESGVNYTKYKVDGGDWTTYSAPFVVSAEGAHSIVFYSIDKDGNQEADQTVNFTIHYLLTMAVKGGLGLTATISNGGASDVTAPWSITLDGGFVLKGKSVNGTVTVPAGGDAKIKDTIIGFGKFTWTITVDGISETGTGTVLLIFIIGVK